MSLSTRSITIKDIAAEVGVSKSSVSLALNNKPGISDNLRMKIFAAAAAMGYQQQESRLKSKIPSPKSITAVFHYGSSSNVDDYTALHSMSFAWLQGIRSFLEKNNSHLTFIEGLQSGEVSFLSQQLIDDQSHLVDGLILMGPGIHRHSKMVQTAIARQTPAAIICRQWPDLPINTVGQSYRQQARAALHYLLKLGHRRIAFAARTNDQGYEWFDKRLAEFCRFITTETNCDPNELIFVGEDEAELVDLIAAVDNPITAIFALHDTLAFRLLDALEERGLNVPGDYSVIGQDDTIPKIKRPIGLTTIGNNHFQVGFLAAETVFKQLENPEIVCSKITLRSYLVERDSCRPLNE